MDALHVSEIRHVIELPGLGIKLSESDHVTRRQLNVVIGVSTIVVSQEELSFSGVSLNGFTRAVGVEGALVFLAERASISASREYLDIEPHVFAVVFLELQSPPAVCILRIMCFEGHLFIHARRVSVLSSFLNALHSVQIRHVLEVPGIGSKLSESDMAASCQINVVIGVRALLVSREELSFSVVSVNGFTCAVTGALVFLAKRASSRASCFCLDIDMELQEVAVGILKLQGLGAF